MILGCWILVSSDTLLQPEGYILFPGEAKLTGLVEV
jgi:hypothetical protein